MKLSELDFCDMCGVSSDEAPLVLNPTYFVTGTKIVELSHQGKAFCCDCLHDELIILGSEEKDVEK